MSEQIIFYILALISIVFSIASVLTKHIIRSVTFLLFVLFSTAAIYLLMQYYYLFAVQIAVYAGGIMVLFIFAILLTNKPGEKVQIPGRYRRFSALALTISGSILFGYIILSNVKRVYNYVDLSKSDIKDLGITLIGSGKYQYLIPFEAVSILLLASIIGGIMIARKR